MYSVGDFKSLHEDILFIHILCRDDNDNYPNVLTLRVEVEIEDVHEWSFQFNGKSKVFRASDTNVNSCL